MAPPHGWLRPSAPRTLGMLAVVFGVSMASFSMLNLLGGGRVQRDDRQFPDQAVDAFTAATRWATVGTSAIMVTMSLTLVVIGAGLRRYERWAGRSAQRWAIGAALIVAALTYVNVAVVGPAASALFAAAVDKDLREAAPMVRWMAGLTPVFLLPFPVVLLVAVRRGPIAASLDQPRRG